MVKVKLEFKNTVLLVEDVDDSKRFYVEILGQEISEDFGRYIGFKGGFGIWLSDFAHKLIFNGKDEPIIPTRKHVELYFESNDLTSIYEQLKMKNIEFIHPIREQPWGQRVLRFYDPDQYIIEVAEPLWVVVIRLHKEGKSIEEIADKTTMPLEEITTILKKRG